MKRVHMRFSCWLSSEFEGQITSANPTPKQVMLKIVVEKYKISGSGFQREIGLFIPAIPKSSRARMCFLGD